MVKYSKKINKNKVYNLRKKSKNNKRKKSNKRKGGNRTVLPPKYFGIGGELCPKSYGYTSGFKHF